MKQSDIFTLILIAGIGVLAAFMACNAIMGDPNEASVEFQALTKVISSDLVEPNSEIFNSTAINPTVEVYVGECEDIDRNGILDEAELAACQSKNDDEDYDANEEEDDETDNENEDDE